MELHAVIVQPKTATQAPFAAIIPVTSTTKATRAFIAFLGDDWDIENNTAHYTGADAVNIQERIYFRCSVGEQITRGSDHEIDDFLQQAKLNFMPGFELYFTTN